jgi:hypothetical protein
MRFETKFNGALCAAASAAMLLLAGCAPGAITAHTAVSDGVKFDYALTAAPAGGAGAYRVTLNLADAKTGAVIKDADVAVDVTGPGIDGDALVNLKTDAASPYGGEVALPQAASYRLTFQVNRHTAPGAQAVFTTARPAAG